MKNCLLNASASGALWLMFLFIVCFFGVHIVRLAKIGWKYRKENLPEEKKPAPPRRETRPRPQPQQPPPPPVQEQPPAPRPEPVYYIVERKRRRTKDSYSEPKEIKFK